MPPSTRPVWIAGLVALALAIALGVYLAPLQPGIVELQLAFTPRRFGEIVHGWSADHLVRYRRHLVVDYALLASYGAFGWLLVRRTRLFAKAGAAVRTLAAACLPSAAIADAAENALHLWLTAAPRFGMGTVYTFAATLSSLKWAALAAFALLCAVALLRRDD